MSQIWNHVTLGESFAKPEVGMGATMLLWTDRHAYTITRVSESGKTFWMKRDIATLEPGTSPWQGNQDYHYTRCEDSGETMVKFGKKGWKSGGDKVLVGVRDEHYDPSF